MTTKREYQPGSAQRTRRTIDRDDPKVRLLALIFATRDNEVRKGSLTGTAAHRVPPTIAKAVARMLREMGEDPDLSRDLMMTIGPSVGDPASLLQHEAFVAKLTEQFTEGHADDPLRGMTVMVQRRAKTIVGAEAQVARNRASSSSESSVPPPHKAPQPPPPTPQPSTNVPSSSARRAAVATKKTTGQVSKASRGRRTITRPQTRRIPEPPVPPKALPDIFLKAMATALKNLSAIHGPDFNQITFLEQALEGYQTAWAAEKRKSSQGMGEDALREFERRCGDTYRELRAEAVRLGVPDTSFSIDDMYRILKSMVQKLGLIVETMAGHVRLKAPAMRRPQR